ncbi:uncharacterized protein J4E84_005359 [Alternaria hordeiaustralica]|uniref:uncharacterized protein n=1 Tax=Alternaria hordeiaustralica TaxID=1187925 RepID=UPI0020C57F26|nr:uncharacterized protein J4E84_005359 [Alternaria hordeiaustralica]KAI4686988.1 hypothetical protein J4E84_005359 [Alternaria hordeiaustralica]
MRYSPFEDDSGQMHEPVDDSQEYLPDIAPSDNEEDDGPIPSLLSSRPRMMEPSVSIPRRRGQSVEVRIPASMPKNPRGVAQSSSSSKAQGKQRVPEQPKPKSNRTESTSNSELPTQEEIPDEVESATHNTHDIRYTINPHETSRGTDYHISFSARDLPTEIRKVPFEQITKHMRIWNRWVKADAADRQRDYKNKFSRFLKAKLK